MKCQARMPARAPLSSTVMRARDILALTLVVIAPPPGGAADSLASCMPMPALVHAEQAAYPTHNPHAPSQIAVLIQLTIQPDGSVSEATVLSTDPPDIAGWSEKPILAGAESMHWQHKNGV